MLTSNISLAPIVLFVFRKPEVTEQVLKALSKNPLAENSTLYIYADGPKEIVSAEVLEDIKKTREIIRKQKWTKEVIIVESEKNKGLANSVMSGVTEVLNRHGRVIVMDDDMCVAKGFLKYMNTALNLYENEERVMQISGYVFPFVQQVRSLNTSYFIPFAASPAWATWKRAWDKLDTSAESIERLKTNPELANRFDLHGTYPYTHAMLENVLKKKVDSWAGYWWWTVFSNSGLALSPDKSLAQYLSSGDKATHVKGNQLPFTHSDFDPNYFIANYPSDVFINLEYFDRVKQALKKTLNFSPNHHPKSSILNYIKMFSRNILGDSVYNKIKILLKLF